MVRILFNNFQWDFLYNMYENENIFIFQILEDIFTCFELLKFDCWCN